MTRRILTALALLTLAAAAYSMLARRAPRVSPAAGLAVDHGPVLIVAVDGFEWNVVLPLLREGRLPNLRRVMQAGSYGMLTTLTPTLSPALWTSIATGKNPDKHGIRDFLKATSPATFYSSRDRRTKAYWNIASERERSVDVLGWWNTFPVEPIHGLMVAQTNTREGRRQAGIEKGSLQLGVPGQVHPVEREAEVFGVLETMEAVSDREIEEILGQSVASLPESARQAVKAAHWSIRADAVYAELARRRLDSTPRPDLLAVYIGWPDVAGHHFWPLTRRQGVLGRLATSPLGRVTSRRVGPEAFFGPALGFVVDRTLWPLLEPEQATGWAGALPRSYEHVDRVLGELMSRQPARATTIVVSDHGMRPWGHYDAPPAFIAAMGQNIRRRPQALPSRRSEVPVLGSIVDFTPTLLALMGLPAADDMDGHAIEDVLEPAVPHRPRAAPIASYDDAAWLANQARGEGQHGESDPERLEQLRALGYIK